MSNIKCLIVPMEKAVAFQVLECVPPKEDFQAESGFQVLRDEYVAIYGNKMRMGPGRVGEVDTLSFDSNESRDAYIAKLKQALREWSAWMGDKQETKIDNPHLFEV